MLETIAVVTTALALTGPCHTDACHQRVEHRAFERRDYVLRHQCNRRVTACIDRAAHLHHVSAGWMWSIAWCESRMDPGASNGTHFGLFQFDWDVARAAVRAPRQRVESQVGLAGHRLVPAQWAGLEVGLCLSAARRTPSTPSRTAPACEYLIGRAELAAQDDDPGEADRAAERYERWLTKED